MQPGIVGQTLAGLQVFFQPGRQRFVGQVARRKKRLVDFVADLQGIAPVDEDRSLACQHAGHAGRTLEAGQPSQALGRRRHVFALVFIATRHQEAVHPTPDQFGTQSGQTRPGGSRGAGLNVALGLGVSHGSGPFCCAKFDSCRGCNAAVQKSPF